MTTSEAVGKDRAGAQLLAMLHLASPQLPVGGFSYSQGLEAAVNAQHVTNAGEAATWIESVFAQTIATWELPTLAHLHVAWAANGVDDFAALNAEFIASRETRELREETLQMGWSLRSLLAQLPPGASTAEQLAKIDRLSFPAAFGAAAHTLALDAHQTLTAYAFGWAENQVAAAIKAVPLGQVAGQNILLSLHAHIGPAVERALQMSLIERTSFSPMLSMLSAQHETQYSRLFRS